MSGLASRARDCGPTSRSSCGQESPRGQASGSMSSSSPHWTRTGFWSRMCWISLMDAEHLKRCELLKMSKKIPIAGAPTRSAGRRLWQIACQWVWNLRLTLGKTMQGDELRDTLVGITQRSCSPFLYLGKHARRVWSVAIGRRCRTSAWSNWKLCFRLSGERKATLGSSSQSVVK